MSYSNSSIKPVVVIPVHLPNPAAAEIVSLRQCGKVLSRWDIVILAPMFLDLTAYYKLIPNARELRVKPGWMESIKAYNQLMMSPVVFSALKEYSHMLLHEPDAIVLRDELDYWCNQPFDYVGAPWFEGFKDAKGDAPVVGVGNSGFSLHRLEMSRYITVSRRRWYPWRQIVADLIQGALGNSSSLQRALFGVGSVGQMKGAWKLFRENCDKFWSYFVPEMFPDFKVAPVTSAVRFSWEAQPMTCMEMSQGKLPFGIHAWAKYDLDFLTPHLAAAGINLDEYWEQSNCQVCRGESRLPLMSP